MQTIDIQVQGIEHSVESRYLILERIFKRELVLGKQPFDLLTENESLTTSFNQKSFYYVLRRLIYMTKYIKAQALFNGSYTYNKNDIKNLIKKYFILNDSTVDQLTNILVEIIDDITTNTIRGKLSKVNSHKGAMHQFALSNNLRCYICGSEVDYYDETAENYREFEHLIPISLGGNKTNKNIFIACARCNKAKKNYVNWIETEFSMQHNIFINVDKVDSKEIIDTIENMEDKITEKELYFEEAMYEKITDEVLFIVCSMYEYKCSVCSIDNDVSEKTYIIKKDLEDYCHPLNLMTICDRCLSSVDSNLLSLENYITRIRISNVGN